MKQKDYLIRFEQITKDMLDLTKRKNTDYANKDNAFANFNMVTLLTNGHISPFDALLVRMSDKMQRMANLLDRKPAVKDEKIIDTAMDLAIYAIIFRIMWEFALGSKGDKK